MLYVYDFCEHHDYHRPPIMSDHSQLVLGASSGPFSAVACVPDAVGGGQLVFLLSRTTGVLGCYHSATRVMTRLMTGLADPVHLAVVQKSAARVFDVVYSEKLPPDRHHTHFRNNSLASVSSLDGQQQQQQQHKRSAGSSSSSRSADITGGAADSQFSVLDSSIDDAAAGEFRHRRASSVSNATNLTTSHDDDYALHQISVRSSGVGDHCVVALTSSSPKLLLSCVRQLCGLVFAGGHVFFSALNEDGRAIDLLSVEAFDCVSEMDFDEEITGLFERSVGLVTTLVDRRQRRRANAAVVDVAVSEIVKVVGGRGGMGAPPRAAASSGADGNGGRPPSAAHDYGEPPPRSSSSQYGCKSITVAVLLNSREVFSLQLQRSGSGRGSGGGGGGGGGSDGGVFGRPQVKRQQQQRTMSAWQPTNSWVDGTLPCYPTEPVSLQFVGLTHPRALMCAGASPAGLATLSNVSASENRGWQVTSFRTIHAAAGHTVCARGGLEITQTLQPV